MTSTKQLHDQIYQATSRLAQRQARELLARQRLEAREREATRRKEVARRNHLGHIVMRSGCDDLADGEIVSALLIYSEGHRSSEVRQQARVKGDAHLAGVAAGVVPSKH